MKFNLPLKDLKIETASLKREVKMASYDDGFYRLNHDEFSLDIKEVAWFYVSGGNFISIFPYPGSEKRSIELYLNGSVYGAVLHQRKILPLHGSCFRHEGNGIMICGDAGSGKSSLTASFCLTGAEFLTDDITPILFREDQPLIWAMSDRIKLWSDTLKQLERKENGLQRIHYGMEKFYYPMDSADGNIFALDHIFILEVGRSEEVEIEEITGTAKFSALRGEIYRPEYLHGMPENEPVYFKNLIDISNNVKVIKVRRPAEIRVQELMKLVKRQVAQGF